ncbi:MAG: thiamine ABC transporter substrate-binding protein [Spirochaetales bacterium]|nr:thiamine ABC transporter substrate-binding protein [Spirochaetales bacterium]
MKRNLPKFVLWSLMMLMASLVFASGGSEDDVVLRVFSADSFSSEWGPGPAIAEAFFEETGIQVEFESPGDTVTVLNQLILEGGETRADVVMGPDNGMLKRVLEAGILSPYASPVLADVPQELILDESFHLLPYDFGQFAICYDSESGVRVPTSLEDLTSPEYEDSLILMDPRTSSPGLGFLLWTVAAYGEEWPAYWERLQPSILTVTDGWSQGYSMFTTGEAPLVLSYGTSPAYHAEYEESTRYLAAEFSQGHMTQIEGMGILAGTEHREEAEAFIDFVLSPAAQEMLALYNIMNPVNSTVELPASFDVAIRPSILEFPGGAPSDEENDALIQTWIESFAP